MLRLCTILQIEIDCLKNWIKVEDQKHLCISSRPISWIGINAIFVKGKPLVTLENKSAPLRDHGFFFKLLGDRWSLGSKWWRNKIEANPSQTKIQSKSLQRLLSFCDIPKLTSRNKWSRGTPCQFLEFLIN